MTPRRTRLGIGLEQNLGDVSREVRRLLDAMQLIVEFDRQIFQTSIDLDILLEQMLDGITKLTGAEDAQVLLRQGSVLKIVGSTEPEDRGTEYELDDCVSGMAVLENRTVASGEVSRDFPELYKWVLGRSDDREMQSEVAVPIHTPEDHPVIAGVLNIESQAVNAFRDHDIELIEQFALQAGAAIHNAYVQEGLRLTLELAELLHSSDREASEVLRKGLSRLADYFREDVVAQFLLLDDTRQILTVASSTAPETEGLQVLVDDSFSGLIAKSGRLLRSNNVRDEHPRVFKNTVGDTGHKPSQSELAVPVVHDDVVIGVLNIESPQPDAFTEYDEYVLSLVAVNASIWQRLRETTSTQALQSMMTVGDVARNMLHIMRNDLLFLTGSAREIGELRDGLNDELAEQFDTYLARLDARLEAFEKRVAGMEDRYGRATEGEILLDVNRIARDVAHEVATREDVQIELQLDDRLPELRLLPAIWDVVWNLVTNALSAIPAGTSGQVTIGTETRVGEYTGRLEAFEIVVSDTGIGIPEADQGRIFELGESTKEKKGGGFGMWFLKTFVDRWGGRIDLASTVGVGTTIRITFPLRPPVEID